jgi:hypothetical protein
MNISGGKFDENVEGSPRRDIYENNCDTAPGLPNLFDDWRGLIAYGVCHFISPYPWGYYHIKLCGPSKRHPLQSFV